MASARQGEGELPLLVGEQLVARRQGEPVVVADRGEDAKVDLEAQVFEQLPDDFHLLCVLLAEVDDVRPDDVEELETDRRHAAEVAWAVDAFEDRAQLGYLHPRLITGRVHLRHRRTEGEIDAGLPGDGEVPAPRPADSPRDRPSLRTARG